MQTASRIQPQMVARPKARRILCEHYSEIIKARGYTLSEGEVDAEIANIRRRAEAGTLDNSYELLAAKLHII